MSTFTKGDHVHLAPEFSDVAPAAAGRTWVVEEPPKGARGVNYKLSDPNGGRGFRCPETYLRAGDAPTATEIAPVVETYHDFGEVVRLTGRVRNMHDVEFWVVIGETAKGYRIAPLGGRGGTYVTNIPGSRLTTVTPDTNGLTVTFS